MDIMRRQLLRLSGIGAVIIAVPQLSSATDAETGGAFKLAMGPVSAPQKRGGPPSAPENSTVTCTPAEGPCPKPDHRSKRRRAGSAVRAK